MTALLEWTDAGGNALALEIDAAEKEGYESTAETSDHAVERGAPVADHVRPGNATFTVEGLISNTPLALPRTQMNGVTAKYATTPLPNGLAATVLTWSGPFDRARACDELFRQLQDAGTLLRYTASLRAVEDCVLTRYRVDRDATNGNDLPVTLELKQLRLVSTQRVGVPQAAQRRAQTARNRGGQPPTDAPAAQTSSGLLQLGQRAGLAS